MTIQQNILVSVIVPIYNTEKYLERTLNSIKDQTYKNIEIICINDASTDNSFEILKKYKEQNSYLSIQILKNETNSGLSFTRNKGIKYARGDYICFIDSDDYISDDFIENLIYLAEKETCDIIIGELRFENGESHEFTPLNDINKKFINLRNKFNILTNGSVCDKMFKTKLIKEHDLKFPVGLYFEDNEFLVKATYYANAIYKTNQASYFYCSNGASITRRNDNLDKKKESATILLDHIFSFFSKNRISKRQTNALIDFCLRSFCGQFIKDDSFKIPKFLRRNDFIYVLELPKYNNLLERLFSIKRINNNTKVITILGIKIRFKQEK